MWNFPLACDTRRSFCCASSSHERYFPTPKLLDFPLKGEPKVSSLSLTGEAGILLASAGCLSSHPSTQPHPEHFTLIWSLNWWEAGVKISPQLPELVCVLWTEDALGSSELRMQSWGCSGQTPKKCLWGNNKPVWSGSCQRAVIPVTTLNRSLCCPWNDRITESIRLEKTSKIIKSNHQPNTTMPAKPCPEVSHPHVFWTPPGMGTPPLPWAAWSSAWPLFQ